MVDAKWVGQVSERVEDWLDKDQLESCCNHFIPGKGWDCSRIVVNAVLLRYWNSLNTVLFAASCPGCFCIQAKAMVLHGAGRSTKHQELPESKVPNSDQLQHTETFVVNGNSPPEQVSIQTWSMTLELLDLSSDVPLFAA
jgi:hypothetical protein